MPSIISWHLVREVIDVGWQCLASRNNIWSVNSSEKVGQNTINGFTGEKGHVQLNKRYRCQSADYGELVLWSRKLTVTEPVLFWYNFQDWRNMVKTCNHVSVTHHSTVVLVSDLTATERRWLC